MNAYEKQYESPGLPHTGLAFDELLKRAIEETDKQAALSPRMKKLFTFQFLMEHMRVGVAEQDDMFPVIGVWGWNKSAYNKIYIKNWYKCQKKLLTPDMQQFCLESGIIDFWLDYAHNVPDWQTILELGFTGLLERARHAEKEYFAHNEITQKKQEFFASVIQAYETAIRLMERLTAVQQEVQSEPEIIQALQNLTHGHATTFHEALLQIWLFYQICEYADGIQTRSYGNLDQLLYPFYLRDKANGADEQYFRRVLHNFMAKVTAMHYFWGHPIYLGGTNPDGSSAINELSYLIIDVYDKSGFYDPKTQVKINLNTPVPFIDKVLDMIRRGHTSVVFVGEPGMRKAMLKNGFSEEEARCPVIKGCYEYTGLHSSIATAAEGINLPLLVTNILRSNQNVPDFDTFMCILKERIKRICEKSIAFINSFEPLLEEVNPSLMFSGVTESAITRGLDGYAGGALHNNTDIWLMGPACACDCLCVIRKFVFEQKKITVPELIQALDANWAGYETLRQDILKDAEKYGNNSPRADQLMQQFLHCFTENINGKNNSRGGHFAIALHAADYFILCGKEQGATPDGRCKGDEYSKNITPLAGQCKNGATSLIQSALSLDPSDFMGGFPIDVALHPSAIKGDDGLAALRALVMVYIKNYGHAIHFNVFSMDELKDAYDHPEKHPELQIRICGWSVLWSNLGKKEQSAYIKQAAANEK